MVSSSLSFTGDRL
uniref:Uncharacterized protein n=1 Tax=Arundo donax TaxID=35708 RepID=A0A0A8ZW41_ARUDO